MFRTAIGLLGAVLLNGCSNKTVPVTPATTAEIQGKSITTAHRGLPDFNAMTAGKAMFGLAGASLMLNAGNALVQANHVEDPAEYMGETLIGELASKHGLTRVDSRGILVVDESPEKIAKQYASARYLLDLRTLNWGFSYFPTDWNNYAATLGVRLRLIDTISANVIAESYCYKPPKNSDSSPSLEQLLADEARRLKDELRVLADACLVEFRTHTLML